MERKVQRGRTVAARADLHQLAYCTHALLKAHIMVLPRLRLQLKDDVFEHRPRRPQTLKHADLEALSVYLDDSDTVFRPRVTQ